MLYRCNPILPSLKQFRYFICALKTVNQPYDKKRFATYFKFKVDFHDQKTLLRMRTFLMFLTLFLYRDQSLQGQGLRPLTNSLQLNSSINSATQLYYAALPARQKVQLPHCKTRICMFRFLATPRLII